MDWSAVLLFAMVGMSWGFMGMLGMNVGIRLERYRHDKEVDAYVIPEENLQDGAYWKMRYEELANDVDLHVSLRYNERGEDARGETTE